MSTQAFGAQSVSRNDVITLVITKRMNVYKANTDESGRGNKKKSRLGEGTELLQERRGRERDDESREKLHNTT